MCSDRKKEAIHPNPVGAPFPCPLPARPPSRPCFSGPLRGEEPKEWEGDKAAEKTVSLSLIFCRTKKEKEEKDLLALGTSPV